MIFQTQEFHSEVKKKLIDLGMTQADLAKKLGIKPPYLNDILKGNRNGEKYMPKILEVLQFDKEEMNI